MRRLTTATLLAVSLAVPASVLAQAAPTTLPDQVNMRYLNASYLGQAAVVATWGGVYVPPYTGQLFYNSLSPQVTLYCVDYFHEVSSSTPTWTANVTNVGGSDATLTRVGDLATYQQTAFLASLFDAWGGASSITVGTGTDAHTFTSRQEWYSGIAATMWSITNSGFPGTGSVPYISSSEVSGVQTLIDAFKSDPGYANHAGFDYSEWSVLTPVNKDNTSSPQEFLVRTPPTTVPEPKTYVLLLSGLLMIWGVSRVTRGRRQETSAA